VAAGSQRRERKVVTVVFCDLVGFTAQAEAMDPEDVEALLRPYHERVRSELERHGGTVEKFIGDAVMALFGAPTAHEDDPERAVRAALAIREFALEEELELRVGITTGEALVRLDANPEAGEGMASGDVVNTAARLQSAAPVNGILVDETTQRATRQAIDYDAAEPIAAKGKAVPIAVWTATAAHSRFGVDIAHEARSELVGRERELGIVRDAFERARHERTPQLLTLVGVPGIGKSRLVYELSQVVEADPDIITWRQGRCLAYGDGITLWALGEIVKAQAGVLEQDTQEEIVAKVHQSVEDTLAGSGDDAWVETHLLELLGLGGERQLGGDRSKEAFSAWRRFLEGLAEQRPLVVVVEDIHWADESLLDFLDELVDWVTDVPLLVVATARPELLERRPNWGGGKLNATTLALSPLSDEQTAELIGKLLARPLLEVETQRALLERAGGNPLYAEQFAELYTERGSADELGLPETLQGIIAARLDGLPEAEKGLLQDAAVVGKVFWASSIGRDADVVGAELHALERKGFVRRQRRSSLEGESEFAFAHALVRDVSYGQIPRADRAHRHRAVAQWIDGLGRPEDHAEMLAYHWSSALELVRASGSEDAELAERTRFALREAGDRAVALNSFPVAARQYEQALELWPFDDEHPDLLFRRARALHYAWDDRREEALATARDALLDVGSTDLAAEAESWLGLIAWYQGNGEATERHLARAAEMVGNSVSPPAARVLAISARIQEIAFDHEGGRRLAHAALAMAESLGLDEIRAHAMTTIGMTKNSLGDPSGIEDMERALELALSVDSPVAGPIVNNLAVEAFLNGDLARAVELYAESTRISARLGDNEGVRFTEANLTMAYYFLGRWDDALAGAELFIAACEAGAPHANEWSVRAIRGSIRLGRSELDAAWADHGRALELARAGHDPGDVIAALSTCAATRVYRGDLAEARLLAEEAMSLVRQTGIPRLFELAPLAATLGVGEEMLDALNARPVQRTAVWQDAVRRFLGGDLVGAANLVSRTGNVTWEAQLRFHAGHALLHAGRRTEGAAQLRRALDFYESVRASFFLQLGEAHLGSPHSESA
jgi:class 3 adenylate cyclase/tetratricopeptide (TPR) repeat protein